MAKIKRGYRFALAPSPAQERSLRSHAGAARFAWNWGLAKCKERHAADLNVAGMTRNRRVARSIADQSFGAVRRMLTYKTAWRGGTLVTADRFYPSSKTCSGCGTVKAKLALSERTYQCGACGLVIDRDVNAARNLLALAASGAESLNAREGTLRPRSARHAPPNLEPGTPNGDKTGTAAPQGTAAA